MAANHKTDSLDTFSMFEILDRPLQVHGMDVIQLLPPLLASSITRDTAERAAFAEVIASFKVAALHCILVECGPNAWEYHIHSCEIAPRSVALAVLGIRSC